MRTQSAAPQNPTAPPTPQPIPSLPWRVAAVVALPGYRLHVCFLDGVEGTVDMSALVSSPNAGVFATLADPSIFARVRVELGAVTWPGEIDLAPDAMYRHIKEMGEWTV